MTAVSADLGLLPDTDVVRPRLWIGDTAISETRFFDDARRPDPITDAVTFDWRAPNSIILSLPGVPVPGEPGAFRCSYQPPIVGVWAVRARKGNDAPLVRWRVFEVMEEPPGGPIPRQSLWLTGMGTAAVSMDGVHLAGATIRDFPTKSAFEAGDAIPAVSATGESVNVEGEAVIAAATQAGGEATRNYAYAVVPGGATRTAASRAEDEVSISEFGFIFGNTADPAVLANNAAAIQAWYADWQANPTRRYTAQPSWDISFYGIDVTLPGCRWRSNGCRFVYQGNTLSVANILVVAPGADYDQLRLYMPAGTRFRRGIRIRGGMRAGLVEVIAETQINNSGGAESTFRDVAVWVALSDNAIDLIRVKRIDRHVLIWSGVDSTYATGNAIGGLDLDTYTTGAEVRWQDGATIHGLNIRGRAPLAQTDPGYNGFICSNIRNSEVSGGLILNSGEHGFRVGGPLENCRIGNLGIGKSGQSGFKVWAGNLSNLVRGLTLFNIDVWDCANHGDVVPYFNDFGLMLQNIDGLIASNLQVRRVDRAYSGHSIAYLAGLRNATINGLRGEGSLVHGLWISAYNNDGGNDPSDTIGLRVTGLDMANIGTGDAVRVDAAAGYQTSKIVVEGYTDGGANVVRWTGPVGAAQKRCIFSIGAMDYSGRVYDGPASPMIGIANRLNVAPSMPDVGQAFFAYELLPAGTAIGTVTANGKGTGFRITSGDPSGHWAVDADGRISPTANLAGNALASYTLGIALLDQSGASPAVPVAISVVRDTDWAPMVNAAATAAYDPAMLGSLTLDTSVSPSLVTALASTPIAGQDWTSGATKPQLLTGAAGISNQPVLHFDGERQIQAATGAALKAIQAGASAFGIEGVIRPLDGAVSRILLFLSTGGGTTNARVNLRTAYVTDGIYLRVSYRRSDTDADVTIGSLRKLTAGQPYYVYAGIDFATGAWTIRVNDTVETGTAVFAGGYGAIAATASQRVTLGWTGVAGALAAHDVGTLALYRTLPSTARIAKNVAALRTRFGFGT